MDLGLAQQRIESTDDSSDKDHFLGVLGENKNEDAFCMVGVHGGD